MLSTNEHQCDVDRPFRAKFFIPSRAGTVHFVGSYSGHKSAMCGPLEQQLNRLITQNKSRVVIILAGLLRMMKYMRNFLPALAAICSLTPSAALATGVVARRRHGSGHHEEARHRSDGGSPATFAVHNEFRS